MGLLLAIVMTFKSNLGVFTLWPRIRQSTNEKGRIALSGAETVATVETKWPRSHFNDGEDSAAWVFPLQKSSIFYLRDA